jgi:hypothetical protein
MAGGVHHALGPDGEGVHVQAGHSTAVHDSTRPQIRFSRTITSSALMQLKIVAPALKQCGARVVTVSMASAV